MGQLQHPKRLQTEEWLEVAMMKKAVVVSEVVQYEVVVDTDDPHWSWLKEYGTEAECLVALREEANTTDGAFGNGQCPPGSATGAWRDVEWR
jgi:hypothetical protein